MFGEHRLSLIKAGLSKWRNDTLSPYIEDHKERRSEYKGASGV